MANILTGDQDDNNLWGTYEDDILRGLGGNDFLFGADGNDTLEGGTGNDLLDGGNGNNTYLFGRGDGQDEIMAYGTDIAKHNTIRFGEDIAPGDITIERGANDSLVLHIDGTTDSITVFNYFSKSTTHAMDEVRFFDGARWDRAAILDKLTPLVELDDGDNFFAGSNVDGKGGNDTLFGTWGEDVLRGGAGNDELRGMDGDDILIGGAGDDLLDGGTGANTFQFAQGWGHDQIVIGMDAPMATIIEVANALPGTLVMNQPDGSNDLVISAKGASDTITVVGFFDPNNWAAHSVQISFADHSVWNYDQIVQASWPMPVNEFIGTEGNDFLSAGAGGNNHMVGAGGDDQLAGGYGDDVLDGGEGNDNLTGDYGNDLLSGGAGDDMLQGGMGNDVLLGGDGFDVLNGGDGDDILDAGAGDAFLDGGMGNNIILFGRNAGEYRVQQTWNGSNTIVLGDDVREQDIVVSHANPWEMNIVIKGTMAHVILPMMPDSQNGNSYPTETNAQLKFADGTVWDNTILLRMMYTGDDDANGIAGSESGDWMDGKGGNDNLDGYGGNDQMRGGSGDDFLNGGMGNDTLLGQDGNDNLIGGDGDDVLNGGAGDDFLFGGSGNNVFQVDLHGGRDTIMSWYQSDANNVLQLGAGIAPEDVLVRIEAGTGNLIVSIGDGQDQVTVMGYSSSGSGLPEGLSALQFANGVTWNNADILRESTSGNSGDNMVQGTNGNDIMDGKGGNDLLMGLDGDDVLIGGSGDDRLDAGLGNNTLIGGTGNDVFDSDVGADTYIFNIGDGHDMINEMSWGWGWQPGVENQSAPNTIRFGAGIAPTDLVFEQYGNTLTIHYGNGDSIDIAYSTTSPTGDSLPVDRFEFADNSVWTYRELSNHAPELASPIGEVWAAEGQALVFQIPAYTFLDRDGEALTYQLEKVGGGDLPSWLQFDPLTGAISGTPGYADSGEMTLKVTASDKLGTSASDIFLLKVTDIDAVPELRQEIGTQNAIEASPFSITIPVDTFVDPDGSPLAYDMNMAGGPLPAWLVFDAASMTLSGTPSDADTGSLQLRLKAYDMGGHAVSTDYTLNIANINQAPVLVQAPASQSVEDGVAFSYELPADMFSDADAGDSGVLAIEGLPASFSFDAQTRTVSGTASLADVGDHALTVSYTDSGALSASAGFALTVTAAASVTVNGSAGADTLTGKSNSDQLFGQGGDDILDGGIGADHLEGGTGNDTFYVDNAGDQVIENLAEGTDTVVSSIGYTLGANLERLTLSGEAAINATGNALNNLLTGNSGANLIDGGSGGDSMAGGAGNDTYMVDNTSDTVTENSDAGFDRVISSVSRTLGANQEALTLTGTATNGTGNLLNNLIQGNGAVNALSGGDGNDIVQGGAGDDTLSDTSLAGNLFDGGLGADRLTGGAGNDLFIGGAGIDTISTGTGADIIAFNRGGGQDSVAVTTGSDNTVSLGHGILFSDLALVKSGSDLILKVGLGETVALKGWYSSTTSHSVGTLQVVTEGGADYVAGSASTIHDNKVEQFDFNGLVAKFDQVRVGQSSSFSWSMASSLEAFSSGGSDTAAIGGDLAYQYALHDSLSALSAMPALALIGSPSFGTGNQLLQGAAELNDGLAVLY